MTRGAAIIVSVLCSGAIGYWLGTRKWTPLFQDLGAVVAAVGVGVVVLLVRVGLYLATATRVHGIAAVGIDLPGTALFIATCFLGTVVLMGLVHFSFMRFGTGDAVLEALRPAIIGALAGAVTGWFLWSGYWWSE